VCSQLCGLAHYRMRGVIVVQSQAEYDAWLASEVAR
jgi:cytochrome c oxidase subunit 2